MARRKRPAWMRTTGSCAASKSGTPSVHLGRDGEALDVPRAARQRLLDDEAQKIMHLVGGLEFGMPEDPLQLRTNRLAGPAASWACLDRR